MTSEDEGRFRALVEKIPAIVYVWSIPEDIEASTDEYISPQVRTVLGFDADEWMASPHMWIERIHPDDREEVLDETERSAEAGEPFKLEYRMIAKDGRVVWVHDVANVLTRDGSGRATRYQGVQLDITDRKGVELAQRRTREESGAAPTEGWPEFRSAAEVLEPLSQREQEVAELLALGHTNTEIAAILQLSVRTIEHHRARVFRKLGVRSRAALVQTLRGERAAVD